MLFEKKSDRHKEVMFLMMPSINLSPFMTLRHFEGIKIYFPLAFADLDRRNQLDPNHNRWYMISRLVEDFNNNKRKMVAAFAIKLLDELMSAWHP
jgi:hypothetical protein